MSRTTCFLSTLLLAAFFTACGSVHHKVIAEPSNVAAFKTLTVMPVDVQSKEMTDKTGDLNNELRSIAEQELRTAVGGKARAASATELGSVNCKIDVVYGNRALRYWVGFGAGSGSLTINLELKDGTGNVRYATRTESELSVGTFGGDMMAVARKTIKAAAEDFASRL